LRPLLFDEGLSHHVAEALICLSIPAFAVGGSDAPPLASGDENNVRWCHQREAVLITNDRGKTDKIIIDLLAQQGVHALFIGKQLRDSPSRDLARAVLCAESEMEAIAKRSLLKHHLRASGHLAKR
jgi:hypothetical protein